MNNISLNGESLLLKKDKSYLIIDGLYIDYIKKILNQLDRSNLEEEIRKKVFVFPRTDTPFTIISIQDTNSENDLTSFSASKVKRAKENDNKNICFSTDTGLLIFIEKSILFEFLNDFDYDKLVDSPTEQINIDYWNLLNKKYNQGKIALMLAPGIDSGFEFVGGGTYKIE